MSEMETDQQAIDTLTKAVVYMLTGADLMNEDGPVVLANALAQWFYTGEADIDSVRAVMKVFERTVFDKLHAYYASDMERGGRA